MFHFHKITLPNRIPVLVKYMQATKIAFYQIYAPWREATLQLCEKKEARSFGSWDPRWSHQLCVYSPQFGAQRHYWSYPAWVVKLKYSMCACDQEILINLVFLHATWQRLIESKETSWQTYPHNQSLFNYFWDTTWVGQVMRHDLLWLLVYPNYNCIA